MPRTNKKNSRSATQALRLFFICIRKEKPLLKVVPNIDGREGNDGSPDISRGNFFDSTEKFIPLHHEQSRTIIIGTVDTAIRDTFKF